MMTNIEIERAVLGALLLERQAYDDVCSILTPEAFSEESYRLIFAIIADMHKKGEQVDMLTVSVKAMELFQGKVQPTDVVACTQKVASAAHIRSHAMMLADLAAKRRAFSVAGEIVRDAESLTVDEILDQLKGLLDGIEEQAASDSAISLKEYLPTLAKELVKKDTGVGLTTGFVTLDGFLSGLKSGRLYVVGGRPAQGKTSVALNIAIQNARDGKNSLFISAEQDVTDLSSKVVGAISRLGHQKIDRKNLTVREWEKVDDATREIATMPGTIFIKDNPGRIDQLAAIVRSLNRKVGLSLVVVDYLQLIEATKGRKDRREQEVSEVSRTLKKLSISERLPIVALSQLKREVSGRPKLSDLRESGAIEQDADVVIFVYRPALDEVDSGADESYGELIIAKNRRGELGIVKFFHQNMAVFSEQPIDSSREVFF
jgi:replicative DNA helicase